MSLPVPDTLEEVLDPVWLSQALGQRYPGISVVSVQRGPIVSRVSTNARFRVECRGSSPRGLPADLCVKGYFADCSDAAAVSRTAGVPEVLFYRHLAAASGVRTLECFYADVDPVTRHGVVITADVAAQGAAFLDALSPYSSDQVAESLEQYAVLHGRTWASGRTDQPWLAPRLEATMRARGLREISGNFEGPIGSRVPVAARDAERLVDVVRRLAQLLERTEPRCLLHGDAHVGNLYLDAAGRPCLVDWQLVQHGPWYLDVGYHIGCTMGPEERRRTESDLLAHYLDRLRAEGADAPAWDDAWRSIRLGLVYGFFLWAITLKVAPRITTVMLERLGTAVADHDAYASVSTA
ncbi:MAG TPA: phosphotransferase [Acidimicrobiales bacterium]|nr:phosphotransferase [Acidimicrobiales bacterium]